MTQERQALLSAFTALVGLIGCNASAPLTAGDASPDALPGADGVDTLPGNDVGPTVEMVWTSDATKMVAEDLGGGFTGPTPDGSTCRYRDLATFTLTVPDQRLTWRTCQPMPPTGLYGFVDGARTLSGNELNMLTTALKTVTVSKSMQCGADKGTLTLTITTTQKETKYLDAFYACDKRGIYVDGIDEVFRVARLLVR